LDRREAGRLLSWECGHMRRVGALVLCPPGGGIIVAQQLASSLEAELDFVLSKKMRAPGRPEIPFGAISETGNVVLDETMVDELDVPRAYIAAERDLQERELRSQAQAIRPTCHRVPVEGRTVILVDDGIETGGTLQAALWAVSMEHPKTLIVGIPVGPEDGIARLADDADLTVCLKVPPVLTSVRDFYMRDGWVGEKEALAILQEWQSGHISACGMPNPAPSSVPRAARPERAARRAPCGALSG